MPTPARVVLAWGVVLLVLTLVNARLAEAITPELQRAEVLSGMTAVGLMLVAVLWTRADPSQAPRRDLQGDQGLVLDADIDGPIRDELGWEPSIDFEIGLKQTVNWYYNNSDWWKPIIDERYKGQRLGLGKKEGGTK